jgi:hypothetical protein
MKKSLLFLFFLSSLFGGAQVFATDDSNSAFTDSTQENAWVAPPPIDENDRLVKFSLQAAYQYGANQPGVPFSFLDVSAKRLLDENSILAEGLFRVQKPLSTSETDSTLDLRLARISYMESWLQVTGGRFDLFHIISPDLFFGAYPLMGIHRVDGVLATIPFSFLFNLGPAKEGEPTSSSPLALSFCYTPSLFSAEQVQYDGTQAYSLAQIRFRVDQKDFQSNIRLNAATSSSNFFTYSSLNGDLSYSVAADLGYQENYLLTAEYGVQNAQRSAETSALALGFQANHLGTWGAFSIDQIGFEAQFPLGSSLNNPFTGGNGFNPTLAGPPQNSWYADIKTRFKILLIEFHMTNSQGDFTLARPAPGSIAVPFTGTFGPGNETNGSGIPLRAFSYNSLAYLIQVGVEF